MGPNLGEVYKQAYEQARHCQTLMATYLNYFLVIETAIIGATFVEQIPSRLIPYAGLALFFLAAVTLVRVQRFRSHVLHDLNTVKRIHALLESKADVFAGVLRGSRKERLYRVGYIASLASYADQMLIGAGALVGAAMTGYWPDRIRQLTPSGSEYLLLVALSLLTVLFGLALLLGINRVVIKREMHEHSHCCAATSLPDDPPPPPQASSRPQDVPATRRRNAKRGKGGGVAT